MRDDDMPPTMPGTQLVQHGYSGNRRRTKDDEQQLRLDDLAAREAEQRERLRERNERAVLEKLPPVFKAAIAAFPGGQEAYAKTIGVARPHLNDMCNGKRAIGFRDVLPLRECPEAWMVLTEGLGSLGKLLVICYRQPALTFERAGELALDFIYNNPAILEMFRGFVADKGIDPDEVEIVREKHQHEKLDEAQRGRAL